MDAAIQRKLKAWPHRLQRGRICVNTDIRHASGCAEDVLCDCVQTLDDANTLAGKSGLITFLQSEEKNYSIVSKCSTQTAS